MIRPLTVHDADAVAHLWQQLVEYHRQLDEAMPYPAPYGAQRYARRLVDLIHDTHQQVYVAEEDGQVVGYVLGVLVDLLPEIFDQEKAGFLADIFVAPEYRRCGIGRELVEAIKGWFVSIGVTHFEWYVASKNIPGIAFWRSVGGRDVMIRMRAPLDPPLSNTK